MTVVIGLAMLALTIHAWVKNIRLIMNGKKEYTPTDKFLNYPLLFIWLTFMTIFSIGIMVNN